MKTIFLLLISLAVILGCSFSSQRSMSQKENTSDTVVCSEPLYQEFRENMKEFFVIANNDTSAYSCIIYNYRPRGTKIELNLNLYDKEYSFRKKIDDASNVDDTSAVGGSVQMPTRWLRIPSYKELLHEIALCLRAASKEYDLSKLYSLHSYLSDLGDIAVMTTNNLNARYKPKENGCYWGSDIEKALKETSLKNDLNGIFKNYGVEIYDISCYEIVGMLNKDVFLKSEKISEGIEVPDEIADCEVLLKIRPIEKNKEKTK